jgi:hypothetical protein
MGDEMIYQDAADTQKRIAYTGGVLYILDHGQSAKIAFPASRWKLVEIGLSIIMAAFERKHR